MDDRDSSMGGISWQPLNPPIPRDLRDVVDSDEKWAYDTAAKIALYTIPILILMLVLLALLVGPQISGGLFGLCLSTAATGFCLAGVALRGGLMLEAPRTILLAIVGLVFYGAILGLFAAAFLARLILS